MKKGKMVQPLVKAPGLPDNPFPQAVATPTRRQRRIERLAFALFAGVLIFGTAAWLRTDSGNTWVADARLVAAVLGANVVGVLRWTAGAFGVVVAVLLMSWAVVRVINTFTDDLARKIGKAVADELRRGN